MKGCKLLRISVLDFRVVLATFFVLSGLFGCATAHVTEVKPIPSQRKGFLDRISVGQSKSNDMGARGSGGGSAKLTKREKSYASKRAQAKPLPQETVAEKKRRLRPGSENRETAGVGTGHAAEIKPAYLEWPLRDPQITSSFGKRGREYHEGLDLRASAGTPVYAAQSGVVLYAQEGIHGYGKLIVIRHVGKLSTIYAHNSKINVKRGQRVYKGQQIAFSGQTGHVTGPHLHFEVRNGFSSVNPLKYLPNLMNLRAMGVRPTEVAGSR